MTATDHNIRVISKENPDRYRSLCTGCCWYSDPSNDEDAVIDAHEAHRKAVT